MVFNAAERALGPVSPEIVAMSVQTHLAKSENNRDSALRGGWQFRENGEEGVEVEVMSVGNEWRS